MLSIGRVRWSPTLAAPDLLECASVRALVLKFLLSSFVVLAPTCVRADVIHLKNGRTIWADHVHENGTHIEYDVGDNNYVIQKSSVERIDAGLAPHEAASTSVADHDLPTFTPSDSPKNDPALISQIIRDDRVDDAALSAAERTGDSANASAAYLSPANTNSSAATWPSPAHT